LSARCRSSTQRILPPFAPPWSRGTPDCGRVLLAPPCYAAVTRKTCRPEPPTVGGVSRFMGAAQKNRRGRTPAGWGVCKGYPLAVAVGKGSFAFAGAVARCLPARRAGRGCPSASEGACVKSTPLAVVGRCPPVWRVSVRCREHKKKLAAALLCGSHPQNLPPRTADRRRDAVRSPPAGGTG